MRSSAMECLKPLSPLPDNLFFELYFRCAFSAFAYHLMEPSSVQRIGAEMITAFTA